MALSAVDRVDAGEVGLDDLAARRLPLADRRRQLQRAQFATVRSSPHHADRRLGVTGRFSLADTDRRERASPGRPSRRDASVVTPPAAVRARTSFAQAISASGRYRKAAAITGSWLGWTAVRART